MRLMVYEGTPEEISQVAATLQPMAPVEAPPVAKVVEDAKPTPRSDEEEEERVYVSVKVARLTLSRRKLSSEQLKVLRAVYEAAPDRIAAPKLQKLTGYTPAQFAGLMGAFGRRMSHTAGYVDDTWFFDQVWDYDHGHYFYGFPESVREALRLEKLV